MKNTLSVILTAACAVSVFTATPASAQAAPSNWYISSIVPVPGQLAATADYSDGSNGYVNATLNEASATAETVIEPDFNVAAGNSIPGDLLGYGCVKTPDLLDYTAVHNALKNQITNNQYTAPIFDVFVRLPQDPNQQPPTDAGQALDNGAKASPSGGSQSRTYYMDLSNEEQITFLNGGSSQTNFFVHLTPTTIAEQPDSPNGAGGGADASIQTVPNVYAAAVEYGTYVGVSGGSEIPFPASVGDGTDVELGPANASGNVLLTVSYAVDGSMTEVPSSPGPPPGPTHFYSRATLSVTPSTSNPSQTFTE